MGTGAVLPEIGAETDMKNLIILGSTGSVGIQALEVIERHSNEFKVVALSCNTNIDLMKQQIDRFDVPYAAVINEQKAKTLKERTRAMVFSGHKGVIDLTRLDSVDMVLNALVGSAGIEPTVSAIENGKDVALANKETLVAAGEYIMALAHAKGRTIYPVDSEHSAIFQCLHGEEDKSVSRLILTCSGGSFLNSTPEEIHSATPAQALKHPKWNMGNKITIDSATLMNKGLEVIEAHMLFNIDYNKIDVVIHPQSIIHSLVEFIDGSVLAQLSLPDMRLPIQYALTYPSRSRSQLAPLNLATIGTLHFNQPDLARFPCLSLAYEAGRQGGSLPCVLNAVNEICVDAFLKEKISFMDIPRIIEEKMSRHNTISRPGIDDILKIDHFYKEETRIQLFQ